MEQKDFLIRETFIYKISANKSVNRLISVIKTKLEMQEKMEVACVTGEDSEYTILYA